MGNNKKEKFLISKNIPSLLQNVPFHSKNDSIERLVPEGFPLHVAVHNIHDDTGKEKYVAPHKHGALEINILIGCDDNKLKYEIQIDNDFYEVESPASIYIPAGLTHAANHVSGKGFFVCIIMTDPESAFSGETSG